MSAKRRSISKHHFIISCFFMLCGFNAWAQPVFNANFAPDTIGPGSITTLTFNIDNSGSANTVTDMAFINILPAGVTIATPAQAVSQCINGLVVAPEGGTTITFTEGRLSAGNSCTVSVDVTSSTVGIVTNTSGDLTSSAGNSGTASNNLTVDAGRPGFSKSFSPNNVNFGDRSTLTFTIDNTLNPDFVTQASFIDNFPIGLFIADPSGLTTDCSQTTIVARPGSRRIEFRAPGLLDAGSDCDVSVDVIAQARGRLNNTTEELSSASQGFQTFSSGKAGDVLVVNSTGDIQLTQAFLDDPVTPGSQVELQFNLSSLNRNFDITNITFTDDLDASLSGLVATGLPLNDVCGAGSQLSGTSVLTLTGANLTPESSCSFNVTLNIPPGAVSGEYPNTTSQPTGQITGQPTNGNTSTDTLFVNFAPELSKTFLPDAIQAGENTSMEFILTNTSTTEAVTDINFNDNLAAFLSGTQITALPAAGFCGAGSNAITTLQSAQLTLSVFGANLAAGDSCTFNVDISTATNTPPAIYTNTTEPVIATIAGQQYIGKSAADDLTIQDLPQLSMLFTDDPVAPGETVTVQYRISVSEEGNSSATNMTFSHDLGATVTGLTALGLPMNDVCGAGSQISGSNLLTLTGGSINVGAVCEFSVDLQVPAATVSGSYPSTTSELSSTVNGQAITSPAATDDLQVGALEFTHEFVDDPSLPGDTVTLRYTIENLSPSEDATDMVFTHSLNNVFTGLTATAPLPTNPCGTGSQISGTNFLIFSGGNTLAGQSCTFDVTLQIPAATANNQYNSITSNLTATIGGNPAVFNPAADVLTINNNLISFEKNYAIGTVSVGSDTTLSFTLTNDSNATITDIAFTDDLDNSLAGLVATDPPLNDVCGIGSSISGTSLLNFTNGSLAAGDSCTFDVTVAVPANTTSGIYTNTTSPVSGALSGLAVIGDPASDDLILGFINFSKSFAGPVDTGATTTLNFTLSNSDATVQSGLAFTDDLDAVLSGLVAVGLPLNDVCGTGSQLSGTSALTLTNAVLAGNSDCSFDVTVQIPAGLSDSTYTNITSELFQNGVPISAPATAELEVNGVPFINLSANNLNFGALEVGNTSTAQTVTVSNNGTADLSITAITAATAPFNSDASGSCSAVPFSLAAGEDCTLAFNFSPSMTPLSTQDIEITSDSGGNINSTIQLSGSGLQANLTLSPSTLDFGLVELNTSSPISSVTLSNNGTAQLDITSVTPASADFTTTGGTCGNTPIVIPINNSCTIEYQFSPSNTGIQSQNLSIISDSANSPDVLTLQGNGLEAELSLGSPTVNFPNTTFNTTSAEITQTLTNSGLIELRITALTAANNPFVLSGGTCSALPITLAVGASCTLGYEFTPTSTGNFNQTITVNSNSSTNPDSFQLTGTGIEPGLQLSLANLDFQVIELNTTSDSLTITLSNTDAGDLEVTAIDSAIAPFILAGGTCGATPFTLNASQSCTLEYQFNPTVTGTQNQSINIISNAATSPDTFTLRGEGVQAELTLDLSQLNFPETNINTSSNVLTQTITNTGLIELNITGLTSAMSPFSISGGSCGILPIVLTVNESCTMNYQITPTTSGVFNQTIEILSNAATSPDSFELMGTGLEIVLTSDLIELNFTFTTQDDVQTQDITLMNNGADDVIIDDFGIPDDPFTADFTACGALPITLIFGESCVIVISYITENASNSDSLIISSNDPNSPLVINLSGNGPNTPTPVPTYSPIAILILSMFMMLIAGTNFRSKSRQRY